MILSALAQYYDRLADDPDSHVPPYGYSAEKIGFCLTLRPDGSLAGDPLDLRNEPAKKPRYRSMNVPRPAKRAVNIAPSFLWDKSSYVLGVTGDKNKKPKRLSDEHDAFKALQRELIGDTDDRGLQAVLAFLDSWSPEMANNLASADDLLDANIVFRLDGDHAFLHERDAATDIWARALGAGAARVLPCLITGETSPVARLHPSIKGVRGGQTGGGSIVAFNLDAFTSYGKAQGENAPISERAAFSYTTALNYLLRQRGRQCVQIGDASTVFWAERPEAAEEEPAFAGMWGNDGYPQSDDAGARDADADILDRIQAVLREIERGRPLDEAMAALELVHPESRFFVLGLAPNAARIAIRFWFVSTLGELAQRFVEHYHDLRIEPASIPQFPSPHLLARETAAQRKSDNIPPLLAGEIARAILSGGRYPQAMLNAVLMRIRADQRVNGLRAGMCKAYLNRNARIDGTETQKEISMTLDQTNDNPGYRLGRLFAVLENVQLEGLGRNINATIRDRYYGAASATPAGVFPILLRGANHHLSNIRKDKPAFAAYFEREIGAILDGLPPQLPGQLSVEDQGRFAIGYYHQRYHRKAAAQNDADAQSVEA